MATKIIIDTDVGEDIDDILVSAFALVSPEFEVLAITTVDGDTQARARIARRLTDVCGKPDIPVAAGYVLNMPQADPETVGTESVTQFDLAPDEKGLPPPCDLPADQLIAKLACEHPGEVSVLTIGSMTNLGQAFVRYPDALGRLRQVVTNGGNFGANRPTRIGWNLRYDPVAASIVARGPVQWVLLPENAAGSARLSHADVRRIRDAHRPLPRLLAQAIDLWSVNKREVQGGPPHLSDLNVLAYLLGGWIDAGCGRVSITVPPRGQLPELRVEYDPEGPHLLGGVVTQAKGSDLRELFLQRILS